MTETASNATPRGPYRRFTDSEGREWLLWHLSESTSRTLFRIRKRTGGPRVRDTRGMPRLIDAESARVMEGS